MKLKYFKYSLIQIFKRDIFAILFLPMIIIYISNINVGLISFIGLFIFHLTLIMMTSKKKFKKYIKELDLDEILYRSKELIDKISNMVHINKKYINDLNQLLKNKCEILKLYNSDKVTLDVIKKYLNGINNYLSLVASYYYKTDNFTKDSVDVIDLRINENLKKLENIDDEYDIYNMKSNINRVIESDKKLISKYINIKKEINLLESKLDYMKNILSMFNEELQEKVFLGETYTETNDTINELEAIANVLDEVNSNKLNEVL